jgi:regulator of Ty1 transposition protein 109
MAASTKTLRDDLVAALPEGFHCRVRYVSSSPKPCDPLFSAPQGSEPEKTRLANHFLTVSTKPKGETEDVLFLGIEALVYTTRHLTTIFVSKADSTGYLPRQRPSPVRVIATTFLKWLSTKERHKHPTRKLVISLFARSQTQYLFPGSADNGSKHVLDDRQLIKWWARVLDPIIPKKDTPKDSAGSGEVEYDGYITVPGYSPTELRPFMPSTGDGARWHPGDPLVELAETRGLSAAAPPRCLLPRFPDDPKARFMLDLDTEMGMSEEAGVTISPSKRKSGKWNSVRDLDRFWEAMEFRQECSSGRMVGFLWLVIRQKDANPSSQQAIDELDSQATSQESALGAQNGDATSQHEEIVSIMSSPSKKRRKPLSGPIVPRQPRLKGGSSSLSATSDLTSMFSVASSDGLILSKEGYDKAMQKLLHLDFSDLKVATQSTGKWVSEVSGICGTKNDWSLEITGTLKPEETGSKANGSGNAQVNDLGGMIRKKRKADNADSSVTDAPAPVDVAKESGVNVLSGGMIRKKPKTAPA